jgi:hypothetical protein
MRPNANAPQLTGGLIADKDRPWTEEASGPDDRDLIIRGLRSELAQKDEEIRRLRQQTGVIEDGVRKLRGLLNPFHVFLGNVFGEMDAIGITEGVGSVPSGNGLPTENSKWEAVKRQNPGRIAEAIEILLHRASMNTSQLAAALHMNRSNCSANVVPKLRQLGLIVGGRDFSLNRGSVANS